MISQLTGTVISLDENIAVIDVGGMGFAVSITTPTLLDLQVNATATIHTELIVRDDSVSLYGFSDLQQRKLFCSLISVSGVGPKAALGLLSVLTVTQLVTAIAKEDIALLSSAPGIGKKTAQRIVLELKGVCEQELGAMLGFDALASKEKNSSNIIENNNCLNEVRSALLSMGFNSAEISVALQGYDGSHTDTQALLRFALQRLDPKL